MVLLLQLNGELPERFPGHERRLYVFACRRPACRRKDGSVCALRGVRVWEQEKPGAQQEEERTRVSEGRAARMDDRPVGGLGDALFGGAGGQENPFSTNANPFSAAATAPSLNAPPSPSSSHSKPLAREPAPNEGNDHPPMTALTKTFAESVSLNAPATPSQPAAVEPWPPASQQAKPYPTSFLSDADYETLDPTPEKVPDHARLEDADAPEPSALDREAFESAMDATFQKFADRLAQNPEQVIRYEFAGAPLLYSKTDRVGQRLAGGGIPPCANCGGRRAFEVQLTPNAIAELEAGDLSLEGMEWGTIIVGVCERDCLPRHATQGEAGYLEEWVGVQWEELAKQK